MILPNFVSISFLKGFSDEKVHLSEEAIARIRHNREFLEQLLQTGKTFYGINTGFGSLCNVRIDDDQLAQLQENLVCSHACGMGDEVPQEIVKLMLLLKVHGLAQGYSGVRTEIVHMLADFYNKDIIPVVYDQGSLGASGDLAPLAHMCLPILGKGAVYYKGQRLPAAQALQMAGLKPMALSAKEGLALLNGTQFMSSYLTWSLMTANRLSLWADVIAAISIEGFDAKAEPFRMAIQRVRPHKGQVDTASRVTRLLQGSMLQQLVKEQVQDPYSFRCVPQVHGATKDVLDFATSVIETEINSVTDNPIVFHDENAILSGGNFHGQPMALQADFMAIAMSELANISERRTYLLISGQRGLPPFLTPNAGLNSGFMIAQYTAAAIVSQNKQYCTPASADSIVSSNGQEDHVSMGANAAVKLVKVLKNVQRVLGIELFTAMQALDFRGKFVSSPEIEKIRLAFREKVGFINHDVVMHDHMVAAERFLDQDPLKWLDFEK